GVRDVKQTAFVRAILCDADPGHPRQPARHLFLKDDRALPARGHAARVAGAARRFAQSASAALRGAGIAPIRETTYGRSLGMLSITCKPFAVSVRPRAQAP